MLYMQKTKKVAKVEIGTKTVDASMDEWLQVCIFLAISPKKAFFFLI